MTSKRVVTYLRISTANQIENTSIETQREKLELYCKLNDYKIVDEFKDEAVSAKSENKRKDYKRLIDFILNKDNKINAVMVYKSDRIHRSLRNLMNMIKILQDNQIDFISITEQFDTSSAQGMLFLQMLGSFSEFERKVIAERTKSGRMANIKNNVIPGGRPPFGYKIVDKHLVIDEEEAEIIKAIFKARIKGLSYSEIGKMFNMHKQTVHRIIKNRIYIGEFTYNGKVENNNVKQSVDKIVTKYTYNKANMIRRYL